MSDGNIHFEHPFATPVDARQPWRRLRGRLSAPVTIWTSGPVDARAGLTMSSVLVADGEPPSILGLMNDTTDLFTRITETGAFVVHVLERPDIVLADEFAGLRPRPGGPFAERQTEDSEFGPVISTLASRAYCRFIDETVAGFQRLVRGAVERIELAEMDNPLVLFRGRYRSLDASD
ncbi:MAG: flavin reductase family protein [Actinomycetota bacterium]|nr:flavin reductase family protein [Actinomycetota bacterium]